QEASWTRNCPAASAWSSRTGTWWRFAKTIRNRRCTGWRALVNNAVEGVAKGWTRELEIVGIGYRAELKGKNMVVFSLGYSHPIEYPLPSGIDVAIDPKQTKLTVTGIDRQKVGQVAAEMRGLRPPDPYKNKGVRYAGERLKKKVGKTGAK